MKRMAVIFNSDYHAWPMGGTIPYVKQTVAMLAEAFEMELWGCCVDGKEPEPLLIGQKGYPIRTNTHAGTRKKWIPNVLRCFWGNLAGSERLRQENYDVLYFHLTASALGWMVGQRLRHPFERREDRPLVILHQHGMAYGNRIADKISYMVMNRVDLVLLTTDEEGFARHRRHIRNPRVVRMPSMVDTDRFRPAEPEEKMRLRRELDFRPEQTVFLYTGRITRWKNPLLLLEAFHLYRQAHGDACCLIYAGGGDAVPELENRIRELRLQDAVHLTGVLGQEGILRCLQAADVFVLPSRGEGVSVAALEAMAAGLPVVAFRVEGMTGLVEPVSGVLVEQQDSAAFAGGMHRAFTGRFQPRETALRYRVPRVREMLVRAIREAMAHKGSAC